METKPEVSKPDPAEVAAILAALPPEKRAKLEAAMKVTESKSRRMSDEEILAEYPLVIKDAFGEGKTTRWNPDAKKMEATVRCSISGCKEHRIAFTSDLFQVKTCLTHRKEQRKAARQARTAERDALIAEGKAAIAAKAKESAE
jgi:hypothetical protein